MALINNNACILINLPIKESTTASQLGNKVVLVTVPADQHRGLEHLGGVEEGAAALVTLARLFETLERLGVHLGNLVGGSSFGVVVSGRIMVRGPLGERGLEGLLGFAHVLLRLGLLLGLHVDRKPRVNSLTKAKSKVTRTLGYQCSLQCAVQWSRNRFFDVSALRPI